LHATEHGPGYSIQRIDDLHAAIALAVVSSPLPLRDQELQFIRSMLHLSQAGLARGARLAVWR